MPKLLTAKGTLTQHCDCLSPHEDIAALVKFYHCLTLTGAPNRLCASTLPLLASAQLARVRRNAFRYNFAGAPGELASPPTVNLPILYRKRAVSGQRTDRLRARGGQGPSVPCKIRLLAKIAILA